MIDPLIIAAVVPALVEAGKGLLGAISRRVAGLSVDDEVKLAELDIRRLQALAAADIPGGAPSQWIVDLRASFRYIAAILVVLTGAGVLWLGHSASDREILDLGAQLIGLPFVLVFGERMVLTLRGAKK